MENSKGLKRMLKKVEINLKIQILLCFILSAIVIVTFYAINKILDNKKFYEYTITENINVIKSLENISIDDASHKIFIDGYAFMLERDTLDSAISLFLLGTKTNNEVWADINQIYRQDVNRYFASEYNYEYSGFRASIDNSLLLDDECYEVILNIDFGRSSNKKRITVSTKKYILNQQLYDYNPDEFDKPDLNVKSDLLRNVFTKGHLCHYEKEAGMYIYQYKGKLYWIATSDFKFSENVNKPFPYILRTSQADRTPKVEYLDFNFDDFEYKEEDTKPYRVAIRDIPDDYAITYITTGHYDRKNGKWFWRISFNLDNLFIEEDNNIVD